MTNVVLILADDMRADLLQYMPFCNGFLKRNGTELAAMRCEIPICSPARAAVITGRHARDPENAMYDNTDTFPYPDTHTLPLWLQPVTASTGMFGKYLAAAGISLQPGWDRWCVMSNAVQSVYGCTIKDENNVAVQPTVHQLKYLQTQINAHLATVTEPFFTYFCPTNPHVNETEFRNNPFPETCMKFGWEKWPYDHLLSDADAATKPSFRDVDTQFTYDELSYLQFEIQNQVREVFDLDGVVKSMWDTLDARVDGAGDRTIWIMASDSGVFYEEQRSMAGGFISVSTKGDIYDCLTRVPSFIYGPGISPGRSHTPMTLQDITATIIDIFDATPTCTQRGTSIFDLLASPPEDRDTLYENANPGVGPNALGIVTKDRKLIKYEGQSPTDTYEMYLLDTDPNEYTNVANDSDYLTERNELETRMAAIV